MELRIYLGSTLIRQYHPDNPIYAQTCKVLGIPSQNTIVPKLAILDNLISEVRISSFYPGSQNFKAYKLNSVDAWIASPDTWNIPGRDYLEARFHEIQTVVGIDMQGRKGAAQWVKKFKLAFSNDGSQFVEAFSGMEFDGNVDQNTVVSVPIPKLKTKYLRIIPTEVHGYKTCRFDVRIER